MIFILALDGDDFCLFLQLTDSFCIPFKIAQHLLHQVHLHPLYLWQVQPSCKQQLLLQRLPMALKER